jgi:hypothetical protein
MKGISLLLKASPIQVLLCPHRINTNHFIHVTGYIIIVHPPFLILTLDIPPSAFPALRIQYFPKLVAQYSISQTTTPADRTGLRDLEDRVST